MIEKGVVWLYSFVTYSSYPHLYFLLDCRSIGLMVASFEKWSSNCNVHDSYSSSPSSSSSSSLSNPVPSSCSSSSSLSGTSYPPRTLPTRGSSKPDNTHQPTTAAKLTPANPHRTRAKARASASDASAASFSLAVGASESVFVCEWGSDARDDQDGGSDSDGLQCGMSPAKRPCVARTTFKGGGGGDPRNDTLVDRGDDGGSGPPNAEACTRCACASSVGYASSMRWENTPLGSGARVRRRMWAARRASRDVGLAVYEYYMMNEGRGHTRF